MPQSSLQMRQMDGRVDLINSVSSDLSISVLGEDCFFIVSFA
jgi:hypothetical protein